MFEDYKLWLFKTAWEYADSVEDAHELAQEGLIAMWRAEGSWDEKSGVPLNTHLMNKARWRMVEVHRRGNFTGKPSQAGKKHSAGTASNRGREVQVASEDLDVLTVADDYDSALITYHYREIVDAINSLPVQQRGYVYRRFWGNDYDPKNSAWWFAKRIGARDRLKDQLSHLESLLDRKAY